MQWVTMSKGQFLPTCHCGRACNVDLTMVTKIRLAETMSKHLNIQLFVVIHAGLSHYPLQLESSVGVVLLWTLQHRCCGIGSPFDFVHSIRSVNTASNGDASLHPP